MAVQVPYPCASPYDGQEHSFPASVCQGEAEGVDSETSWNKQVEVEVADEGCFACSQEIRDEMEALGAEGVLPSRHIEGFLRVFKQLTHNLPSRQVVSYLSICPPL